MPEGQHRGQGWWCMGNLDDKLNYILKSNAAVQVDFDRDSHKDYALLIPAIKQAFLDEGYKKWIGPDSITSTGIEQTETEIEYNKPSKERFGEPIPFMTGQEAFNCLKQAGLKGKALSDARRALDAEY